MPPSFPQSFYRPKLLLGASFLFATAQAQINFFPATEEACKGFNFPCQGGILCCPRPAICIPYLNELVCLGTGGSSVDSGTGGNDVNGLIGDILGGDATSLPPGISGGEVGPVVLPTIPSDGGEIAFTPSISGGGVGPIVIPTLIDGGGITFPPSFAGGEVTPIVIPTPPPVRSGGDDGALAGEQTITPLPPPSTTTKSPSTSTPPILSSTIPAGERTSGDDNGFLTSRTPSSAISISILPSFTSVAKSEGGGKTAGGDTGKTTDGETAGGKTAGGETAGGDAAGGDTAGGKTAGGETEGGKTAGGEASGGETGKTTGGTTTGGKTAGGETATPTDGGSTSSGSASGPGPTATAPETSSFTGAASPRSVRGLSLWSGDFGLVIALGVTIAGMSTIMVG